MALALSPKHDEAEKEDVRGSARTNIFLAAVMEVGGCSLPVRLRNLSTTGALVEGATLPQSGVAVTLVRASLRAPARVVWSKDKSCGLAFSDEITVRDWIAEKAGVGSLGQQRVDEILAHARSSAPSRAGPEPLRTADVAADELNRRLAEELASIQRILEELGDAFMSEPAVLANHAESLQQFDITSQILGHVAKIMVAADPPLEATKVGMVSLRSRLLRKGH